MDVLITDSQVGEAVSQQYVTGQSKGSFRIQYTKSGTLTTLSHGGNLTAVVSGCLFGSLNDAATIDQASKQEVGRLALESDGSFAVFILREGSVTIVTDAGGSIPIYYAYGPSGFAVGTLVHHVAAASGCTTIDKVSVVDYLFNQTVCYPYSWYEDVRVVPPGSVCSFSEEEKQVHSYWKPVEPDNLYDRNCDTEEWGQRLRGQVQRAVHLGIEAKSRGRVMYSGGEDSRAVLSLVPDSFECTPTTVLDGGDAHREYELARRSAELLGRTLEWVPRPQGYYRSMIPERIARIGPGWDFRHTHIFGPVAEQFDNVEVVLGGYMADTLFKTLWMSNIRSRPWRPDILLDPIPDKVIPDFRTGEIGQAALWSDLVAQSQRRRTDHHRRLKEIRPRTAGNWHQRFPLSNQPHYAHYLSTLRMSNRVIEPFLFHQSYQLAASMPDYCRVEQRAFRAAFAKGMGRAGMIMTSSGRVPKFSNGGVVGKAVELVARYARGWPTIKRKLFTGDSVPQGPWPPDHSGWHPVQPEEHFDDQESEHARHLLRSILAKDQTSRFWKNKKISKGMRVRALALGFDLTS